MMRSISLLTALAAIVVTSPSVAQSPADQYWDPQAMERARQITWEEHGGGTFAMFSTERFEWHRDDDDSALVWESSGWWGGDRDKLWFKTEGEREDGNTGEFELQALYSRAVSAFWDWQIGLRQDIEPASQTYLAVGMQGLAPYWFEVDATAFVSERGDLSVRLEAEYELRLTQRAILQPRVELVAAADDDKAAGIASGLSHIDAGLRLRYEITPQFAPYLGVSWEHDNGATDPDHDSSTALVAGFRFWF